MDGGNMANILSKILLAQRAMLDTAKLSTTM
jgi:hypothetical protein